MKRMALGFPYRVPYWMGAAGMGQVEVDHDKMLADLTAAEAKIAAVSAWQSSQTNVNAALGADAAQFQNLLAQLNAVANDETDVSSILNSPDPAAWHITPGQKTSVDSYIRIASDLTDIVQRAQAKPASLPAIPPALPGIITNALVPRPSPAPAPKPVVALVPARPSEGWPWWAYGLTALAGLGLVGGLIVALAPKRAASPSTVVVGGRRGTAA
jgi:hypothetical protein